MCVSVCLSVYAEEFVVGHLRNKLTDLNENFGVCYHWPRIENVP